jgi:tetratricopeptide (TPR) repeat protein
VFTASGSPRIQVSGSSLMTERIRERTIMDSIGTMLKRKDWSALLQHWSAALDADERFFLASVLRQFRGHDVPAEMTFEFECLKLDAALRLGISTMVEISMRAMLNMKEPTPDQQAVIEGYVARVMESTATAVSFRAQLRVTAARKYGDMRDAADALLESGRVAMVQGRFGRAEEGFMQAFRLFEQNQDVGKQADVLLNLGILRRVNVQFAEAIESFTYAEQFYQQAENIAGQITALRELGYTYRLMGETDKAADFFQRSYDLCEHSQDEAQQALALLGLADIWGSIQRYDMAEQSLKFAWEVYEKLQHNFGRADVLLGLTQLKMLEGNLDEARQYYDRLRSLIANANDVSVSSAFSPAILAALERKLAPGA